MNFPYNKLAYFPFIGWLLPLMFESEDDNSMFHSKQGLVLAIAFTGLLVFFFLLSFLLPETLRIVRFSLVILIYIIYLVYFSICLVGTYQVFRNRRKNFPLVDRFVDRIDI